MSTSLVNDVPPHSGHFAPRGSASASGVYQASAPDLANSATTLWFTAGSFKGLLHPAQANPAMGTPHTRCRELHQPGRVSTTFAMRSSPQPRSHFIYLC